MMKLNKSLSAAVMVAGLLATSTLVNAADSGAKAAKPKPYTLKTCPVSDEKLGSMGDPYVHNHNGREIKFCCKGCLKDFNADSAKYIKKIDIAEAKAAGLKPYLLDVCPVSDEKLGEHGEPVVLTYKARQVKLCCEGCQKDFKADPAKFIGKIEASEKKAQSSK